MKAVDEVVSKLALRLMHSEPSSKLRAQKVDGAEKVFREMLWKTKQIGRDDTCGTSCSSFGAFRESFGISFSEERFRMKTVYLVLEGLLYQVSFPLLLCDVPR